jgi:hypothetical protein
MQDDELFLLRPQDVANWPERMSVRRLVLFLIAGAVSCIAVACTAAGSGESPAGLTPVHTTQEIMQSMVGPQADMLWNAVSISVTEKGPEMMAPSGSGEWMRMRHAAVTLSEAMNLVVMEGRAVGPPGAQAADPKVELGPEQIEALIGQERESWIKLARDLQDAVAPAVKAIDARDAQGLSKAGEGISAACEACHKKFWYPNDVR